jgi:hypothetical protein
MRSGGVQNGLDAKKVESKKSEKSEKHYAQAVSKVSERVFK